MPIIFMHKSIGSNLLDKKAMTQRKVIVYIYTTQISLIIDNKTLKNCAQAFRFYIEYTIAR